MSSLTNVTVIIIVTINIIMSSGSCNNIQLLKDYTESNDITVVLLVSCETDNELFKMAPLVRDLQHRGLWTNVWDISTDVALNSKFFDRYSNPPCIVINLRCNQTKALLTEMSKRVFFHHERMWLMWCERPEEAFDYLNGENINFDAEIIVVIPSGQELFDIYEAYNPSHNRGGRFNITAIGQWSKDVGWNVVNQTKIERRHDLNGITFPMVIALENIPTKLTLLEHLSSNELVHLDTMSRYMYRLFLLMMEMFNFKANFRSTNLEGSKVGNGSWHGAVGALNGSQVDFCATGLRWDDERYGVYEQTTEAYHSQFLFIFRHPKTIHSLILTPFHLTVWLVIFIMGVCSALVMRQTFFVENYEIVKGSIENGNITDDSYSNSILMIFSFMFQQGYDANPSLISSRVLLTTMLTFAVLIYQYYSSFIVGSLLTEAPKNIKTVKQLLLNSRFEFGVDLAPYVLDNFHSATEESTVELYNKIMTNPGKALMPLPTGLSLLKRGGFVFNTDGSYAYHVLEVMLTDSEKCDLQDIFYLPKQPVGPGLPFKSPYRELVKISIRRFSETGILSYYQKTWYGVRPKCAVNVISVAPIDIVHFSAALYILLGGAFTSAIILVLEIMVNRKHLKRKM